MINPQTTTPITTTTHEQCKQCLKRSHILFECRCKNKYCTKHLLPELHACSNIESFKTKKTLEKTLPKTVAIKVDSI